MSRSKKTPLNPWESVNPTMEKHFSRLGDSLMDSEIFNSLSSYARLLYLYMIRASAGKETFTFQHGFYTRYRMTNRTFCRLRDELVNAGFIKVVQNNKTVRKANVYQFSNAWKIHEGKRDKIIRYDFSAVSQ